MSVVLDNNKIGAVGEYVKENTKDGSVITISSPIFTIYAFEELRKVLEKSGKFKFLFNEPTFIKRIIANDKEVKEFELQMHQRERNVSEFNLEIGLKNNLDQNQIASKCYTFIKEKGEIKSVVKSGSVTPSNILVENKDGSYLIQGNNVAFSKDGLGYTNQIRFDFNTVSDDQQMIEQYHAFINQIFNNEDIVTDVKDELLKHLSNLYKENSPELLYYLTLYNIFGEKLLNMDDMARVKERTGINKTKIWNALYNFQHDAVVGAIKKLELYNGCIIADSVGLGKTFEALAIIKYYELRNDRVLVLCPKKLRSNWTGYRENSTTNFLAEDRFNYDVLNHTDLSRDKGKSGDINLETINWGNYDLVVIDESHNFRNNTALKGKETRYQKLMNRIIKSGVKTKVLMLSATPVNNRLADLKNQIMFITEDKDDAFKESTGINSIETTYQLIMKDKERLLSFDEPIRFIFSHSALKEGWDNPNVFQVCTLVETKDTMTKRQKIGRGLRICVNQNGERVLDSKFNTLSVIANESYKDFASTLQKELENDNFKFGIIEPISFTGIAVKQYDGTLVELSQKQSEEIYNYLVKNEYMTSKGKITNKYHQDKHNDKFMLPEQYESFTSKVMKRIDNLSREIEIKDASTKVAVKLNKEVQLSPEFVSLWNKIKQKTVYTINMDMDKFKKEAVEQIQNMPHIRPDKIDAQITNLDITKQGVKDVGSQVRELGAVYEFDTMTYPDFIRRLQDSTDLLRKTIIEIVSKSGRLKEFYENPEEWIKQVSKILLSVKKENLTEGIKYEKVDDYYEQDFIFNDEELYGYKDRNILDVSSDKNIYDHVIYDSEIEREFAIDAENDDDVLLYAKLPSRFKIDTPIGNYNPDWAVVLNTFEGEKLYFVAETKGTENINDLKGSEKKKILCGRKHFEVIDTGIKYEVVKELKTLKDRS